jgi:hypothetical protein
VVPTTESAGVLLTCAISKVTDAEVLWSICIERHGPASEVTSKVGIVWGGTEECHGIQEGGQAVF